MANSIGLREHQLIMLDILKDFASFCDENGLSYYLDSGTLLGAVRHKGFIPWDNDVDVGMLRPDFDKFVELLKERNYMLNDHIILEMPDTTIYPFLKLGDTRTKLIEFPDRFPIDCYVYIDIFPKDGLVGNGKSTEKVCKKSHRYGLMHWFLKFSIPCWKATEGFPKKQIACVADFIFRDKNAGYRKQEKFIRKHIKKHPIETCDYVTTLVNGEFYRICPKRCFDDFVVLEFEGYEFKAPIGYAEWLRVLYGDDYMTPPPKDKQEVHNIEAYWIDG